MAGDVRQFIRRQGVTVRYATAPAGGAAPAFADYHEIGHIQGNLTVNDQKNTVTVRDFDTDATAFDLQYADGRTGSVTFGLNLVPGDAEHKRLKTDYAAGNVGYLWVDAVDGLGTNRFTEAFIVTLQTFPRTYTQDNVATGNVTFLISSEYTPPATP